jgi:hypothetical protein
MKMKHRVLLLLLVTGLTGALRAQNLFTSIQSNLPKMGNSCAAWGDFDKDGDLDAVMAGETSASGAVTKLFRNDSGVFTEVPMVLPGVHLPSLDWGDYNGDGELDLLIAGQDSLGIPIMKILRNKNGNLSVTGITLPGIYDGRACWGDFNNDNYPDILLTGVTDNGVYISKILRNENGGDSFTDIGAPLMGFQSASACWVDYNNDGQPDACISGDSGGGIFTKLYRNDHGTFTEVPFEFAGLASGQVEWADMDNDGDPDLLESGMDQNIDGHIILYKNDGNDQFTQVLSAENNLIHTSSDIGDYDNDGWLDLMVIGQFPGCGGTAATILYQNEWFMNFFEISTLIPGYQSGSVQWGDFNNDGYSDLLFTGYDGFNQYSTEIYRNDGGNSGFAANTPPSLPSGLVSSVTDNTVTLTWNRASDAQTPATGLSYNVFAGTSPNAGNVLSPLSDLSSGFPMLVNPGNASPDTSWIIKGLPAGTYYWSVQAIDNGFMGSVFPSAESFTVTYTGVNSENPAVIGISPNPASDFINLSFPKSTGSKVFILNAFGQRVREFSMGGSGVKLDLRDLPSGMYLVQTEGGFSGKFVKR